MISCFKSGTDLKETAAARLQEIIKERVPWLHR